MTKTRVGGARFATLRSPVGHGIPFGWVGCPTKSRGTDYLSPTGGPLKLAASGTCLGPKGPGKCNDQACTWTDKEKVTNVTFQFPDVHWVRHHSHVASLAVEILCRRRMATPSANCEPCHQTSHERYPYDAPDYTPSNSASI